jgi:hypothetical protein
MVCRRIDSTKDSNRKKPNYALRQPIDS